jgi:hypothetical protein
MSALAIVLIVLGGLVVLLLLGGFLGTRRHARATAPDLERNLRAADRALEEARASDRGWDRAVLEAAARKALEEHRPALSYEHLVLVLVDDRPGVTEDRCHMRAGGADGEATVILTRGDAGWTADRVE